MGFGRFVCVALPFTLTLASLICILIAMLSGTTNHTLDMYEVNTKNLSISSSSLANLVSEVTKRSAIPEAFPIAFPEADAEAEAEPAAEPANTESNSHLTSAALNSDVSAATGGTNFTASQLGLADSYQVFMWNYCSTTGTNTTCTKAKFNWAASALNITAINAKASAASGVNATLPAEVTSALKSYVKVSKWTQVVYIIAIFLTAITLVSGLFGFCSRAGSCFTYLISGLATTALIGASLMSTISSAAVVLAVKSSAKAFNVTATLHRPFLSVTWLAVVFSIGSGLFWLFSICCCKSERRDKGPSQKFGPSAYTPINEQRGGAAYGQQHFQGQQQGMTYNNHNQVKQQHGSAYEPYSHANV